MIKFCRKHSVSRRSWTMTRTSSSNSNIYDPIWPDLNLFQTIMVIFFFFTEIRPKINGLDRDNMSRFVTKPTKWHVRPAKTQTSLGRVFAVRMKKAWVLSYPLSAQRRLRSAWASPQRRLWSDWADAQADLSLRWAHMPFCWFCHGAAHIIIYWHFQQWRPRQDVSKIWTSSRYVI